MKIRSFGSMARQIITRNPETHVLGVTSQGIFLHTNLNWVLFLTGEAYHGPLTLNLDHMPGRWREEPGDPTAVRADGIWFPKSGLWAPVEGAEAWNPPPTPEAILPFDEIQARVEDVSRQIRAWDGPATGGILSDLSRSLKHKAPEQTANLVRGLLGLGPGLTPAGDDLVMGLLLALNRWGRAFCPDFPLAAFNTQVTYDAQRRTTTLSANIIEAATLGQTDERIITGLDGLATGSPDTAACAACFNGWGNTSGASAFAGVKLVLTLPEPAAR